MVYIVRYAEENILETDEINKAINLYTEKYLDIFNKSNKDFKSKISYINFILNIIEKDEIDNEDILAYYYYEYTNSMIIKIDEYGFIKKTNITTYLLYDIFNEFYSITNEYNESLKTYIAMTNKNININNIPDFFREKYEALSMMDENGQLDDEDNKYLYYEYYYLIKYNKDASSDLDSLESEEIIEESDESTTYMDFEQTNIQIQDKIKVINKTEDDSFLDDPDFIDSDDFIKEELISIIEHLMNNEYMNKDYINNLIENIYNTPSNNNKTFWDNLIEINYKKKKLDEYKTKNYKVMLESIKEIIEIKKEYLEYPENTIELCYLNGLLNEDLEKQYNKYYLRKKRYNKILMDIENELENLIKVYHKNILFRKHIYISEQHILYKIYKNGLLKNKQNYYDTLTYYFESDEGEHNFYELMFKQEDISNNYILDYRTINEPELLNTTSIEQMYFRFDCLIKNINYSIDKFDINIFNQIHKKYIHKDKDLDLIHKYIFDYFKRRRLLNDNNQIKMFNEIYNFIINEILQSTNYSQQLFF